MPATLSTHLHSSSPGSRSSNTVMPLYQMQPTRALEMLIPVVATQLLLQEATESTLHIRNQAPSRLLNRFKEILTNIALPCRAQEWYGTYRLLNNYSRQLTSHQVIQLEETRANLTERFDEDYEIQQQRFTILRQLGIGHVLLFREMCTTPPCTSPSSPERRSMICAAICVHLPTTFFFFKKKKTFFINYRKSTAPCGRR